MWIGAVIADNPHIIIVFFGKQSIDSCNFFLLIDAPPETVYNKKHSISIHKTREVPVWTKLAKTVPAIPASG